jgi:hypothetical protein
MLNLLVTFLLTISASLYGNNDRALLAGDVSPAAPKSANAADDDTDDTGEVDEDVIITDDDDSTDDEGVNN